VRVVSVLSVAEPTILAELDAVVPLADHLGERLGPSRVIALPSFEEVALPALREAGVAVLERFARRSARVQARVEAARAVEIAALPSRVRAVLHAAQRHALDGVVRGLHAWDPLHDQAEVRALFAAGLLALADADEEPLVGAYRLAPDLPEPPPIPYDLREAAMAETDDLPPSRPGPVRLLHDVAGLAAVLFRRPASRTHAGTLSQSDARRIGKELGADDLAASGRIEEHPRWGLALRALEALGGAAFDPMTREVFVDVGLDRTLRGSTADAVDRLVHRLVDRDLHAVVPAVRAALRQAVDGAVDEMIFLEELSAQHREILFPRWSRSEGEVYPHLPGERVRAYDERGWERVEAPMVGAVLRRLERLGLIRRAPGVFAGTEEGRAWALAEERPTPPIWVSSDLEVIVPPESLTPSERYDLERVCVGLGRDVVDRYRIDRAALLGWLATGGVDEVIELLERRSPGVPAGVRDTLLSWARAAERVVLTRGVLVDLEPA